MPTRKELLQRKLQLLQQELEMSGASSTTPYAEPGYGMEAPPDQFPPGGSPLGRELSLGESFEAGGADTLDELALRLNVPRDKVWASANGEQWVQLSEGHWSRVNQKGLDFGDIARALNDPAGAGAVLANLFPYGRAGGMLVQGGKAALGGLLGSAAGQGSEMVQGLQGQTFLEAGQQALTDAALEGALGAGGVAASKLLPGGAPGIPSVKAAEDVQRALRHLENYPQYPRGLAPDLMKHSGLGPIPGPLVAGAANQANNTTGILSAVRSNNALQAQEATEGLFMLPPGAKPGIDTALGEAAMRRADELRGARAGDYPQYEAGAAKGKEAVEGGLDNISDIASKQYGVAGRAALREKPEFDLGPMQSPVAKPALIRTELVDQGLLDPNGNPLLVPIKKHITRLKPEDRVAFFQKLINSVDPKQTDWKALQNIRTAVGDQLKEPYFRDWKDNPALDMYRQLSQVIENPVNGAPDFVTAWKDGNLIHEWKMGLKKDGQVRALLKSRGAGALVEGLAQHPTDLFSPEMRELLDLAPEGARDTFRQGLQLGVLDSSDPLATLRGMKKAGNQASYNYMFGSPAQRQEFESRARQVSQWAKSPEGKMYNATSERGAVLKVALNDVDNAYDASQLMQSLQPDEQGMLSEAVIDKVVRDAVRTGPQGEDIVNAGALANSVRELKRKGQWDTMLSPDQQERLLDLESHQRVFYNKMTDVGASLENASLIANLKGLLTPWNLGEFNRAVGALHGVGQNMMIAKYLASPGAFDRTLAALGRTPRRKDRWALAAILGAPAMATVAKEKGKIRSRGPGIPAEVGRVDTRLAP